MWLGLGAAHGTAAGEGMGRGCLCTPRDCVTLMCPSRNCGGTQWLPPTPGRGHRSEPLPVPRESTAAGWLRGEGAMGCLLAV